MTGTELELSLAKVTTFRAAIAYIDSLQQLKNDLESGKIYPKETKVNKQELNIREKNASNWQCKKEESRESLPNPFLKKEFSNKGVKV